MPAGKTYRAAVIEKAGGPLTIKELPHRDLKSGEVLIRVISCGLCHGDHAIAHGHLPGITFPVVLGHEIIGQIEKINANVPASRGLTVGTRVGRGWHGGHCFGCEMCLEGLYNRCKNAIWCGSHVHGGYAEYVYAPWESLAIVPEGLDSIEAGPLMCAGVTVFNGLRQRRIMPPALVAVQGLGGLGHLGIQFAAKMGYKVVAVSSGSQKEKVARELGAHYYIDASKGDAAAQLQKLGGANAIVATASSSDAMSELFNGLAVNGQMIVVGFDIKPWTITPAQAISNGGSIIGHGAGTPLDSEKTLRFAALNDVKCQVETFPFEKVQEAFDRMASGKAIGRAVLTFN